VPDVIERFKEIMAQTAGRRITLNVVPPSTPGWVLVSPSRLERVLLNLVTNARDAMPSGGTITVTTTEKKVAGDKGPPGATSSSRSATTAAAWTRRRAGTCSSRSSPPRVRTRIRGSG
jgi:signal transduction histidine kinase